MGAHKIEGVTQLFYIKEFYDECSTKKYMKTMWCSDEYINQLNLFPVINKNTLK